MKNEELYGWIFSYNPFKNTWRSVNRDNYYKLWNESASEAILESPDINSIIDIIIKGKGDLRTILKIKEAM